MPLFIQEVNLSVCSPFIRVLLGSRSRGVRQCPLTRMLLWRGNLTLGAERSIQLCTAGGKSRKENSHFRLHFPSGQQPEEALIPFSFRQEPAGAFLSSLASFAQAEEKWLMTFPVLSVVQKHGLQL